MRAGCGGRLNLSGEPTQKAIEEGHAESPALRRATSKHERGGQSTMQQEALRIHVDDVIDEQPAPAVDSSRGTIELHTSYVCHVECPT